jgi:hypothetical protein
MPGFFHERVYRLYGGLLSYEWLKLVCLLSYFGQKLGEFSRKASQALTSPRFRR